MSHSYQYPSWSREPSEEELQLLARQFFKTPKALHAIVLVRVPTDDVNRPQVTRHWQSLQQEAVTCWEARAREDDLCLHIERRWIPHQCVFLPDTEAGQEFQEVAEAIAHLPMHANVRPKNQNQAYWLKTQHYLYQARGLLVANQLFGLLAGNNHPRNLLQGSVGIEETRKIEQLAAADTALYTLTQAVVPELGDTPSCSAANQENLGLRLFVEIQEQAFIHNWNAGPANKEYTWTSLQAQEDWHLKHVRFLKKLGEQSQLLPREAQYRDAIAETGRYWEVLNAALSSDSWPVKDSYEQYVKALAAAKSVCISDINWHQEQPYKLERKHEREMLTPRLRPCSTVPESECDCPFRHLGTDLTLSNCLKVAQQEIEPPRRANTPRPIDGTINLQGFIVWTWH